MRALADSMIVAMFALRLLPGRMPRRVTDSIFITLLSLTILAGCSTQSAKTVETQKTVHYATENDPARPQPVVTEKQTARTEETTKNEGQSFGLLSGTVHVVGEVIALPFRTAAGLINLAF